MVTNGVNIPNNNLGIIRSISKRSKTPAVEGPFSQRKYQSRMFPPPTKPSLNKYPLGGLNFSFRQSLDLRDLNQDLRSESMNIENIRPYSKDKYASFNHQQKAKL